MSKVLYVYLLLMGTAMAVADPDTLLKSSLQAQDAGNYAVAISKLQQLDTALGQSTPRVESLKVYAYVSLQDWKNARIALTRYQQLASPSAASANHQELLKLAPEIDRGLAEADKKWRQEREQVDAAEIKALADQDAVERRTREAALRRSGGTVAQLEEKQRTAPPEPAEGEFVFRPEDVTEKQIASLASDLGESFDWLDRHAENPELAPLAARVQTALSHQLDQPGTAPLLRGSTYLIGFTRETDTQVFDELPEKALAEVAGQTRVFELYPAAGRWVLAPRVWPAQPDSRAYLALINSGYLEHETQYSLSHGHLVTSVANEGTMWIASFLTFPVRQTRPTPVQAMPADFISAQQILHFTTFPDKNLQTLLENGSQLVSLDFLAAAKKPWTAVVLTPTARPVPGPPLAVLTGAPALAFQVHPDATTLAITLAASSATPIKLIQSPGGWISLSQSDVPPRPLHWVVTDSLDDPILNRLHEAGLRIHLLAGPAPRAP